MPPPDFHRNRLLAVLVSIATQRDSTQLSRTCFLVDQFIVGSVVNDRLVDVVVREMDFGLLTDDSLLLLDGRVVGNLDVAEVDRPDNSGVFDDHLVSCG